MVTRPFSSVIGMSPIRGFKDRFLFLGPTLAQNVWSPLIDDPFNDGFLGQNFNIFFQLNEMRDEAKTWWLVFAPDVASSYFFKENPCRTWITNPHLGTAGSDNNS